MGQLVSTAIAKLVNFTDLMKGHYFTIPEYQRHYAWTEKECRELFEDCALTAKNPDRERFMSTITVVRNHEQPLVTDQGEQITPLMVVDGQQRLTSLLILISCICRRLQHQASRAERGSSQRVYSALVKTTIHDGTAILRVRPQPIPEHPQLMERFLSEIVALEGGKPSISDSYSIPAQRHLITARWTFEDGLKKLEKEDGSEPYVLSNLLGCVTDRLIFVLNTFEDAGRAGEIFEGLNNRGRRLNVLEELKAFAIYAVQSFRRGDALPGGMPGTAPELIDQFNNAIGIIYHRLDRVGLRDDKEANDFLIAAWPLVWSRMNQANLAKGPEPAPETLDPEKIMDTVRNTLRIQDAISEAQQKDLLDTLRFFVCQTLVGASEYFADARRPRHQSSFGNLNLPDISEKEEVRKLHQRLVDMLASKPFLSILLGHRIRHPDAGHEYLLLSRLVERVAFRVYVLASRKKGTGQKLLAGLARSFADADVGFDQLLLHLRGFGISAGTGIDTGSAANDDFREQVSDFIDDPVHRAGPAVAYEWLLSHGADLPTYGKFVREAADERFRLVSRRGAGRTPLDFKFGKHVVQAGNIIVLGDMLKWDLAARKDFVAFPYEEKRKCLESMGYKPGLPPRLTKTWANEQRGSIVTYVLNRWAIPPNGQVKRPTWRRGILNGLVLEASDDFEDEPFSDKLSEEDETEDEDESEDET